MYLLAIFSPLIGSLISILGGRWVGSKGASLITCSFVSLAALFSTMVFYEVALCGYTCHLYLTTWISCGMFNASWSFLFDSLTGIIMIVVTYISALVHFYSVEYIAEDPHRPRFISHLSVFTFFILLLVSADNFVQIFLGWEGVGLASYLLINFWHTRLPANKAAIKAMLVNRVGDVGLTLGLLIVFYLFHSIDYATVFAAAPSFKHYSLNLFTFEVDALTAACIFLFVGSIGKSAQLGLHTWLPDAIEGPTPVSALIHAATMVTAGVFLVARCSPIFEMAPISLSIVALVGGMTALFAATTGVFQNDLKKVIAYSTCSQLGYMIFACGTSNYATGIFHLANHAFFKALLFLGAGSVIHALADEQDMRRMGGLAYLLPFTYTMMLIGSLSLTGFPFLTGYYSKDLILELASTTYSVPGHFVYWVGISSVILTSFYSFRVLLLTFLNNTNAPQRWIGHVHESPSFMSMPMAALGIGSIFSGYLIRDMMVGTGTDFWGAALFSLPYHTHPIESEFSSTLTKWAPFLLSNVGIVLALLLNVGLSRFATNLQLSSLGHTLAFFFNKKWYWDNVYSYYLIRPALGFGYNISFKALDRGVIEIFGPLGLTKSLPLWAKQLASMQSGQLAHYAFMMLVGTTFLVTIVELWDVIFLFLDYRTVGVLFTSALFIMSGF